MFQGWVFVELFEFRSVWNHFFNSVIVKFSLLFFILFNIKRFWVDRPKMFSKHEWKTTSYIFTKSPYSNLLTNKIKKNSTSDPARALDLTLMIVILVHKLNGSSEKLVLKQSSPKPIKNIVQHFRHSKNESPKNQVHKTLIKNLLSNTSQNN